ncbi:aminotransferase [Novosphingobium sp. B 225]|uniref:aminotransferase n=1 Tax=Novosphingobium sp. B 225 TaxID=1961849 RepID=UPI000B4BDC9F|nr:aminotransferase [Novosphingobium sp. B 225]
MTQRDDLPRLTTTVFERMSRLSAELGAINLGQGFPDMPEPAELVEAACRALRDQSNQYPPMRGLPALRGAVADYYALHQGLGISADEVMVTSGATEALASAILAVVRPGDEVVLIQPLYDAYLPLVQRAGGTVRLVSLTPPHWTLDLAALEAAIGPRTRAIVLNSPNNPAGALLDRAALEGIGALAERHNLYVISDEVWEGMTFGSAPFTSTLAIPSLRGRTFKIGSAGKLFSMTGWKVGWIVAAPRLLAAAAQQHQFLTFTTATPLQWAAAEGLALPAQWHQSHRARYAAARERLVAGLTAAGFVLLPADGTWFVVVDLATSGLPATDDVALAEQLLREAGVAAIPVSAFYAERPEQGYLRLCFAKTDATLDEAVARLTAYRATGG